MNLPARPNALSVLTLLVACALPACSSGGGASAGGGSASTTRLMTPLTSCVDDDITDAFAGPGFDPRNGGLQPPIQASYVAATTVLLQSSDPAKQASFNQYFVPVMADVQKAPGLIGLQIARSDKCHYGRTLTVWKDADALMAFVTSPNHAAAVAHATQTGDAEAVVSWEMQATDFPPTWAMARDQIAKMGYTVF
jgi:heme-degrading monooxygenase HmoA